MLFVICLFQTHLVDATSVAAGEHVLAAWLLGGTVVQGGVLVGSIHTVWVSIADPFLGYALGTLPGFVLHASELRFLIALAVI